MGKIMNISKDSFKKEGKMMKEIATILVLIVICFVLFWLSMAFVRFNRWAGFNDISFATNLERIHLAIIKYAEGHSGKMPDSQNWADVLMNDQKLILKRDFVSYKSHPSYGIFYNENLNNQQYSELKSNCVVLFEGKGQWNDAGSKNTFYSYASRTNQSYLVTLNGDIYIYYSSSRAMMRSKDDARIDPNDLVWE